MTMRLATEPTLLSHGGNTVRLRPSLRAATLLLRKARFGRLVADLHAPRLDTILLIVEATADDDLAARALVQRQIADRGTISLYSLVEPLVQLLADCFGVDADQEHRAEQNVRTTGKPFDMAAALVDFYEIGTGWLGWTPAQTWSATPAEIMAAHKGLVAKLQAIHGSGESGDQPAYDPGGEISPEELQTSIATLRAIAEQGRA